MLSCKKIIGKDSVIDCVINNFNIQCKAMNIKKSNDRYRIFIQKNNGKVNGKRKFQPYSDRDDIDFFILEILDFPNHFYIIPMQEMINKEYIQTNNQTGRKHLYLPNPTSTKPHWSKQYLNNFDQLKINEVWERINSYKKP